MKNYIITVNGISYDVAVEEVNSDNTQVSQAPVRKAAPKAAPAPAKSAPAQTAAQGGITVNAPMPGKIIAIKAEAGTAVKKGQAIIVLEAMKMENEIVAPEDGTVASINVAVGDSVESGAVLATLN